VRVLEQAELPSGELYALYPSRRFQAMKVKAFIDFVVERLQLRSSSYIEVEG
jgi:DNA-binding transcriptional LysR family regulator